MEKNYENTGYRKSYLRRKGIYVMKAAIYQGKENIEIKELPDPVCTDDGVILENIYASICGTDVAVYKHGTGLGHKIEIGGEFGHEVVCRIKEKGANSNLFTYMFEIIVIYFI